MCRFAITVRHTALLHSWEQNISTFHISSERQNSLYVTQGIILNHRPTVDWILEHSAQCCRLAVKLVMPSFVVWRRRLVLLCGVVVWCRRLASLSLVSSFLLASFGVTVVGITVGGVAVVVLLALVSLFCSRRCRCFVRVGVVVWCRRLVSSSVSSSVSLSLVSSSVSSLASSVSLATLLVGVVVVFVAFDVVVVMRCHCSHCWLTLVWGDWRCKCLDVREDNFEHL